MDVLDSDINILLLGSTGDGMTTFINAFINYLAYDTLDIALKHELKVLIPALFTMIDFTSYESHHVIVGIPDENENFMGYGESSTKTCRSYVFHFSNRRIRFIDTPGMICSQGIEQEMRNVENILNYVKHFTHLNTILIFSREGQAGRTSYLQYVFEQLFGYLDDKTKDNIAFVFSHGRSTFYELGSPAKIMRDLFLKWEQAQGVKIPLVRNNGFLFDSEGFHFVAAKKSGVNYSSEAEEIYCKSWNHSSEESRRLIDFVLKCPIYPTSGWKTLYESRHLVCKTARQIAELVRLIEENISLAKYYKDDLLRNPREQTSNRVVEKIGRFVQLDQAIKECHHAENCSQKNTSTILRRKSIDLFVIYRYQHLFREFCSECRSQKRWVLSCDSFKKTRNEISIPGDGSRKSALNWIDRRIRELRQEQLYMKHIYTRILHFIKKRSFIPVQHILEEYFCLFLEEEKEKQKQNATNDDVIRDLQQSIDHCKKEYDSTVPDFEDIDDLLDYVTQLYKLPIYGKLIQDHFEILLQNDETTAEKYDRIIDVSSFCKKSKLCTDLNALLAAKCS